MKLKTLLPRETNLNARVIWSGLALVLIVWVSLGWLLESGRQAALVKSQEQNARLALALSIQVAQVLSSAREAMDRLAQAAEQQRLQPGDYARFAAETGLGDEVLTQLAWIGPDGYFVGSNVDPTGTLGGRMYLGDRPHFVIHVDKAANNSASVGAGVFVGQSMKGRDSQQMTIQISKPVIGQDAQHKGVVVASLRVEYFNDLFNRMLANSGDVVALVGSDQQIRAVSKNRYGLTAGTLWDAAAAWVGVGADDPEVSEHMMDAQSFPPNQTLAQHKVSRAPLHVVVTTPIGDVLKSRKNLVSMGVGLASLFSVAILAMAVMLIRGVTKISHQTEALKESEARLTELSDSRGKWLEERTTELQGAQAALIQAEKMAEIGQLVASVAHEINTPIASIQSTGKNIAHALAKAIDDVPGICKMLTDDEWMVFRKLLEAASQLHMLSSKEERALRRALAADLQAREFPDADALAEALVGMVVDVRQLQELAPLLQKVERLEIIQAALNLSEISRGTSLINTSTQRVANIVYALKSLSHKSNGAKQKELVAVEVSLENAINLHASDFRKGVVLDKQFDAPLLIPCFQDDLIQVWLNLISNALHAMSYSGELVIKTRTEGPWRVVTVQDTGPGIPEAIMQKIFNPFFTTKPVGEGSGLGLGISKQIIEAHGGLMEVSSELGVGTIFKVYLPTQDTPQTETEP